MWHRLQSVVASSKSQTEVCATPATLSLGHLSNYPTKLAEPKFFVRSQQWSLCIQNPIILSLQAVQVRRTAAKKLAQQTLGPIAIDRLSDRFARRRCSQTVLGQFVSAQKSGQQTAVITLSFGVNFLKLRPRAQTALRRQRLADFHRRVI